MKRTTPFNKLWAGALALGALGFSACEKEEAPACSGAPAIDKVSTPTDRAAALASGNLADWVIIQGSNFCGVSSVMFNDVEASMADAYITPTEITLRIPRAVPKEVTNKIKVVSAGGAAETAYTLTIPALQVTGLSNEYAAVGQRVAVVGQNFDLYGITAEKGKVLWNGVAVPITRATADSLYVVVPATATPGASLKVVDPNNVEKAVPGRYKDNRGSVLFSYDTGGSVWGGDSFITEGPTPAPVNGKYLRINQSIDAWAWTEFSADNLVIPAAVVSNPANYVLRFEVNTLKPFGANAIKFMIDGNADKVNTYQWKPQVPFHTRGRWSTMTIPMSELINTPLLASKALHEVKFIFHGDGKLDADISFDNFRIVPKD